MATVRDLQTCLHVLDDLRLLDGTVYDARMRILADLRGRGAGAASNYHPVADANERVRLAKLRYTEARAAWRFGDASTSARVNAAQSELDEAHRAASLALATYRGTPSPMTPKGPVT